MVKIKISYQTDAELENIKRHLKPVMLKCAVAKTQKGAYKRAYIEVKQPIQTPETPENT